MDYSNKKTLNDINVDRQKVIVRVDFNVPIKDGVVVDNKRIMAPLETIRYLIDRKCKIILLSHLSRIKTLEDMSSNKKSLSPVADELQRLLTRPSIVKFLRVNRGQEVKDAVNQLGEGNILLLENTRYNDVNEKGEVVKLESKCDQTLSKEWASLADIFVNDAFGTAHRKHASNVGIAENIQTSCVGFLVQKELENLSKITNNPKRPVIAILGGAKVSDKLKIIDNLLNIADKVLICGGMCYTFWKAQGKDIGSSLLEQDMVNEAKNILVKGQNKIILANDFICAKEFADSPGLLVDIEKGLNGLMGLDIGNQSIEAFKRALNNAGTVFWNGPAGVFEFNNYQNGTRAICDILKNLTANGCFTLIGGGDSASAAKALGFHENDFSFISTGGGASLEFIEGSSLPGIEAIKNK